MNVDDFAPNELKTVGNKFMHRDELSFLCELFFYQASQLEVDIRYNLQSKGVVMQSFQTFIKRFYDMYYRFAEVSNNPDYIAELEEALDKHSFLNSRDPNEVVPKCKYFLNLARRLRHQLKVDGLYNPEIVMKYNNNPSNAWESAVGGD